MGDSTVPLAAIGLVASILGLVVTPLFKLLNANTKATTALVEETRKGNREAKERNGHLGEQSLHLAALVSAQNRDIEGVKESTAEIANTLSKSALITAEDRDILVGGPQVVTEQHVEHQHIEKLIKE